MKITEWFLSEGYIPLVIIFGTLILEYTILVMVRKMSVFINPLVIWVRCTAILLLITFGMLIEHHDGGGIYQWESRLKIWLPVALFGYGYIAVPIRIYFDQLEFQQQPASAIFNTFMAFAIGFPLLFSNLGLTIYKSGFLNVILENYLIFFRKYMVHHSVIASVFILSSCFWFMYIVKKVTLTTNPIMFFVVLNKSDNS